MFELQVGETWPWSWPKWSKLSPTTF